MRGPFRLINQNRILDYGRLFLPFEILKLQLSSEFEVKAYKRKSGFLVMTERMLREGVTYLSTTILWKFYLFNHSLDFGVRPEQSRAKLAGGRAGGGGPEINAAV